jgi:hypothetical protein
MKAAGAGAQLNAEIAQATDQVSLLIAQATIYNLIEPNTILPSGFH